MGVSGLCRCVSHIKRGKSYCEPWPAHFFNPCLGGFRTHSPPKPSPVSAEHFGHALADDLLDTNTSRSVATMAIIPGDTSGMMILRMAQPQVAPQMAEASSSLLSTCPMAADTARKT